MRRVVITGMGIVSSIGNNTQEVLASLYEAKSGISRAEKAAELGFRSQVHGAPTLNPAEVIDRCVAEGAREVVLLPLLLAPGRHGAGDLERIATDGGEHRITIAPPAELLPTIVERGSIAVDGVSLTVAGLDATTFDVAIIPTTLELTSLGTLAPGGRVNLETDYLVKAVARYLECTGRDEA